jgi:hypothetical protein
MNWVPGLHRVPEEDDGNMYPFYDLVEYSHMKLVRNY